LSELETNISLNFRRGLCFSNVYNAEPRQFRWRLEFRPYPSNHYHNKEMEINCSNLPSAEQLLDVLKASVADFEAVINEAKKRSEGGK